MIRTYRELGSLADEWNRLALDAGTPFMSHEWLSAWCNAFGDRRCSWIVLHDEDGSIRACTCVQRGRSGKLASATNVHNPDWEVLARDEQARSELWSELVHEGASRIVLQGMRGDKEGTRFVSGELERAGYRAVRIPGPFCPWLPLPSSWEELLEGSSSSLRAQVRRRRRGLEREGAMTFRVSGGPATLEHDLEMFLQLEASGWKGRNGTAILSKPSTHGLYREFARGAAAQGWLRLYFLELDGEVIAADFGCAFAGTGVFLKTGFNEAHGRLSPGLVLRAEVLRSSIEEGLGGYDFLGDPDIYKTRWTSEVRPRLGIWAYRREALPGYLYRKRLRPLLKSARNQALELRARVPERSSKARG
jgi:CelD/BcsL family acetyltransferase involved in cellulose biosynthesis